MLKRLPPRLRMFLGTNLFAAIGYLAATGFYEMLRGRIETPSSALMVGWIIGSIVAGLMLPVPTDRAGAIAEREQERSQFGRR